MTTQGAKHTPGWSGKTGDLYVYVGEEGDAIAVAMHGRGPQGGWMGIDIARMALPNGHKTQEQLNTFARQFAAAPDLLSALKFIKAYAEDYYNDILHKPQQHDGEYIDGLVRAMEDIEAAIAKATGGEA